MIGLFGRNHAAVVRILGSSFVAIVMLLFILTSVYHMWLGMQVIIEEAGGRYTTFDGKADIHGGSAIASNGALHDAVLKIVAG